MKKQAATTRTKAIDGREVLLLVGSPHHQQGQRLQQPLGRAPQPGEKQEEDRHGQDDDHAPRKVVFRNDWIFSS